jgi:hypothetical protein
MRDFAMTKTKVLLLLTCILLVGCPSVKEGTKKSKHTDPNISEYKEYKGGSFAIACPNDITIEKKTPVEDFDIYTFLYRGKVILSAYTGNQPSFDKGEGKGSFFSRRKGQINGLAFKSIRSRKDGISEHEVLIDFGNVFPQYIHYWYSLAMTEDEKAIAEGIIHSTKRL